LAAIAGKITRGENLRTRRMVSHTPMSSPPRRITQDGTRRRNTLNLLIEGNNHPRLQKAIEAVFPPEPTAPKPYVFTAVTDPEQTLARLYTTKFFRKSWYSAKKKTGTAKLPLTSGDLQELLAFLVRYPIGARLVLNGLHWDGKLLVPDGT
jgi:hypothetical protein